MEYHGREGRSPEEPEKNDVKVIEIEEEHENSPIEEVRLTVPADDDPTEPVLTFRVWILGLTSCVLLSFLNQFFGFRTNQIGISSVSAQILSLPIGRFLAAVLPTKKFGFPFTNWKWSFNPGPFSMKEHALITIFAGAGSSGVYAIGIITIVKAFYHRDLHPGAAWLLTQTTQMLGYGWAGIFRKILVDSPYMWWPGNLVQVALFTALHKKEKRPKGGLSRLQYFLTIFVTSFVYYLIPSYLFPSISTLSFICWIWKDSVTAQQIGSGVKGLGIGSIGIDWSTVSGFIGSPLATPGFAIFNILAGFFFFTYVAIPAMYWTNTFDAKKFPFYSTHTFDSTGHTYNISRILNQATFDINLQEYNSYSKLYLSIIFAFNYGLSFATLGAALVHVGLFNGKQIYKMWSQTKEVMRGKVGDVHTRLMKKNYKSVPEWWFHVMLVLVIALAIFCCEGFDKQLQLPWWGVLLACFMAFAFTLPIGIITATTNQQPGLNVFTELIIGYIYPGKPVANVTFKTFGYISMVQAINFMGDFKLGLYMKIPPRSMFLVQILGTVISSGFYFHTAWYLLTHVNNICQPDLLPAGSPWTCPGDDVFYNASIIWGVVGPYRMFTSHGIYGSLNWFFLVGLLAPIPVWLLARKYPEKKWIPLVNMPVFLGATALMPPARAINYICWGIVGIIFNVYIYRRYKGWWGRHTYVLSAGLDAGVAFMAVLIFFTLQNYNISGPEWWGLDADDHCDLARCPTAPGIKVHGCPVL